MKGIGLHSFCRHAQLYGVCSLKSAFSKKQTGATSFLLSRQKCHHAESGNYVIVEEDSTHKEMSVLKMNRKPFNGFNKEFMDEMSSKLESLENGGYCRGVILTSANPGIFSAGLDIGEIHQRSSDHIRALWRSLQEFCVRLYGTRLVTIAAVNGHATAGGCLMALSCDYRIMAEGKYSAGFSTSRLGVITPFWVQDIMRRACGSRTVEKSFQLGTLYKPDEALAIGLVDEVVGEQEIMNSARTQMLKWLQIPDDARVMTKSMIRAPLIQKVRSGQEEEIAFFTDFIQKDAVQESIGRFMERLKRTK